VLKEFHQGSKTGVSNTSQVVLIEALREESLFSRLYILVCKL